MSAVRLQAADHHVCHFRGWPHLIVAARNKQDRTLDFLNRYGCTFDGSSSAAPSIPVMKLVD
jgi:hypothetical protein